VWKGIFPVRKRDFDPPSTLVNSMKTFIHYLKIIGMCILGCWIVGLMLTAAVKFTLSMLSVFYWGLIMVGIYALGEALLNLLA